VSTLEVQVQRFSVVSSRPFAEVLKGIEAEIGHPEMRAFGAALNEAGSYDELEQVVRQAVGPSGLMEFTRFDMGQILRKEEGASAPQIVRLVVGNPLIMKQMAVHVHDTASYAPVDILLDERPDGVHLSYDRMASLLAPYGSAEALQVAQDLDTKVEALMAAAAGDRARSNSENAV
jgi:uncharacterized protein (DUF302 family)